MNLTISSKHKRILISFIALIGIVCTVFLWNIGMTTKMDKGDFIGYWSAAYLIGLLIENRSREQSLV